MRLIRVIRSLFAFSRSEVCEKAGLSIRELTRIEAGEVVPSPPTIQKLDDAFYELIKERLASLGKKRSA